MTKKWLAPTEAVNGHQTFRAKSVEIWLMAI